MLLTGVARGAVVYASLMVFVAQAACVDPLREPGRFKMSALELLDTKTQWIWFRCPALYMTKEGQCDASMVLPSETWAEAMEIPRWALKRRSPWRLASNEELDTIAAEGCDYLINPKAIEVMFSTVWTRSEATDGQVYRYGVDRQRTVSAKELRNDYAQALYVRDAP